MVTNGANPFAATLSKTARDEQRVLELILTDA
jgi:hypothetical protein